MFSSDIVKNFKAFGLYQLQYKVNFSKFETFLVKLLQKQKNT